jgi:hypothetical protein
MRASLRTFVGGCVLVLGALLGCGSSEVAPPTADTASPAATPATSKGPAAEVVHQFLEAIRRGDDVAAEKFLSQQALEETRKHNLAVDPPGSETARFEIIETEPIQGGAHVLTRWTDEVDGEQFTTEMIWVLRDTPQRWEIVGAIIRPFDDLPPFALDFEDPEDFLAKERMIAEEMHRRTRGSGTSQPTSAANGAATPPAAAAPAEQPSAAVQQPPLRR